MGDIAAGTRRVPEGTMDVSARMSDFPEGMSEVPDGAMDVPAGMSEVPEGTIDVPAGMIDVPKGTSHVGLWTRPLTRRVVRITVAMRMRPKSNAKAREGLSPRTVFDYDRTVVAFHGTRTSTAARLVAGEPFDASTNDDDWLGHGVYFWEYAPQRAWEWATQRYAADAAVVGALVRFGRCLDRLDPSNATLLRVAHADLEGALAAEGLSPPRNVLSNKYLDCAVFNWLYDGLAEHGYVVETSRAVFVPLTKGGLPRMWAQSGVFAGAHIQLGLREPNNILALWSVRRDGRYGKDDTF